MREHEIRGLLDDVKAGRLSRRNFVQTMVAFGLTAPLASQFLANVGMAQTSPRPASMPTKRGGVARSGRSRGTCRAFARSRSPHARVHLRCGGDQENKWQRFNVWRWRNEEYDRLYKAAETEMDPVKRAALFIRMNDLVVQSGIVVPIVLRAKAAAMSTRLRGIEHNVYKVDYWNLAYWSREA